MSPVTQAVLPEATVDAALGVMPGAGGPQAAAAAPGDSGNDREATEIGDAEVADWLHVHPEFFDRHADLLAEVRIRHPHGGRAVSLVERQVLVLRERNKALESKMAELIHIGQDNDAIGSRLQQLTRELLRTSDAARLPEVVVEGLMSGFAVPKVAIRLWGVDGVAGPFCDEVSAEMRRRTDEITQPYCGPNSHPEAAAWLPEGGEGTASIAMLALRLDRTADANPRTFGLLVLGSPDAGRFQAGMGTAFLERIAEIASASLSRLLG